MTSTLLRFAVLIACLASICTAAEPPDGNPRTVYFTVGDAQDLLEFPPMDSRNSIATVFETLKEQWQVSRIWWRGGQDEIWGEQFVIRPENRLFAKIWDWWRDMQYRTVGTNRIAVEEAHQRGMEIWLTYGLFDNGSQADAGYSGFPYAVEDKLRVAHPEWAPVNRWGTWRQGGPIEFAYPEAREAMATYLAKAVIDGKYDGMAFLAYAENFSQRYEDEFGYAPPIVDEYRRKYGVDILTQEFDRDKWRRLRGSYVTEFLRLLKSKLAPHGKKIAMTVDGQDFDRPTKWLVDGGVRTAGNFTWDINDWLKGDVVDEIQIGYGNNNESVQKLLDRAEQVKSPVLITAFRSRGDLPGKTPRTMFLGREIESGYPSDHWIDYPDETLTPEPASSLASDDIYARRRVVTLALKDKLKLTPEQWMRALHDSDLFVRRTALRAIAKHKISGLSATVKERLTDPENTVRCLAVLALAETGEDGVIDAILTAAFQPHATFQLADRAAADGIKKLAANDQWVQPLKAKLVQSLSSDHAEVRYLTLYYFTLIGAPATPDVESRLLSLVRQDPSEGVRELALVNLSSSFGPTQKVTQTIRQVMSKDASHAVQVRAATAYASMFARLPADDPQRAEGLKQSIEFFRQYGDGCQRTDADWGWRLLGNAIAGFGPAGEAKLNELMADADNRQLSDRAWKILYLKQGDKFYPITEAEDVAAHKLHPWLKK